MNLQLHSTSLIIQVQKFDFYELLIQPFLKCNVGCGALIWFMILALECINRDHTSLLKYRALVSGQV